MPRALFTAGSSIEGVHATIGALRSLPKRHAPGIANGLAWAGEYLLEKAQEIVPVDTGELHNSGAVEVTGSGFDAVVDVSFTAEHAVVVHEDMEAHHAPGKSAKYLERPLREHRSEMNKIIEEESKPKTSRHIKSRGRRGFRNRK